MNRKISISVIMALMLTVSPMVLAQQNITIIAPTSQAAEGLNLYAVAELFKDSHNLEAFERALNDPRNGINNLDLDEDGYVDYIRVVEYRSGYTRVIILQVPLGMDEFQDVATIEIEQTGYRRYNMQVRGNEIIYGYDYYIAPVYVHVYHIHRWPIITWIFSPAYRPYYSVFYYGYYPVWWTPYRPVAVHVYHTRVERSVRRTTFESTRVSRVETARRVNYKPQNSPRVEEKVRTAQVNPEPVRIPRPTQPGEQTAMEKKGIRTNDDAINKTQPRSDVARTGRPVNNDSNISNKAVNKPDRSEVMRNSDVNRDARPTTKPQVERRAPARDDAAKITRPQVESRAPARSEAERNSKPQVERRPPVRNEPEKMTKPQVERKAPVRNEAEKISKPQVERRTTTSNETKSSTKPDLVKNPTVKRDNDRSTAKERK